MTQHASRARARSAPREGNTGSFVRALVVLFAAAACGRDACAAEWFVDVGGAGFTFAPSELVVNAGDTVTFVNRGGFHNVVADDNSFRCASGCDGDGGNGNPSDAPWTASVVLAGPGTLGYHCEVHGLPQLGMYGSITVIPRVAPPPASAPSTVPASQWRWLALLAAAVVATTLRIARNRR